MSDFDDWFNADTTRIVDDPMMNLSRAFEAGRQTQDKKVASLEGELAKYKHTPKAYQSLLYGCIAAYEIMEANMLEAGEERDRYEEALQHIMGHQKIVAGSLSDISSTYLIAKQALEGVKND